jgi:hypothetical protein
MPHFDIFGLHLRDFISDIVLRTLNCRITIFRLWGGMVSESDYNQEVSFLSMSCVH